MEKGRGGEVDRIFSWVGMRHDLSDGINHYLSAQACRNYCEWIPMSRYRPPLGSSRLVPVPSHKKALV